MDVICCAVFSMVVARFAAVFSIVVAIWSASFVIGTGSAVVLGVRYTHVGGGGYGVGSISIVLICVGYCGCSISHSMFWSVVASFSSGVSASFTCCHARSTIFL